jgi:sigma-B regulation protein RsbU (phosphoserine phosphatase)
MPFFTIVYGIIDSVTQTATIARAGHLHPLLHKKGEPIVALESEGPAIGIFKSVEITEKQFAFGKNDRLYLFSDGLVESLSKYMHDDGNGIVKESLEKSAAKNLDDAVTSLEKELNRLKGPDKFDDDIVFMAFERK